MLHLSVHSLYRVAVRMEKVSKYLEGRNNKLCVSPSFPLFWCCSNFLLMLVTSGLATLLGWILFCFAFEIQTKVRPRKLHTLSLSTGFSS